MTDKMWAVIEEQRTAGRGQPWRRDFLGVFGGPHSEKALEAALGELPEKIGSGRFHSEPDGLVAMMWVNNINNDNAPSKRWLVVQVTS